MYLTSILRATTSILILCATLVTANLKTPTFTKVFDGTLVRAANLGNESGPYGLRQLVSFGGGNLTDPATGKVVANFIPGVGGGLYLLGTNGEFYPDVRAVAQFVEDSSLAYFDIRGVRDNVTAATHAYLETDSPKYKHLSAEFLFFAVNVTTNPFIIAIYRLDNGKHHGHW